jgi:CheY-like chemotaxis protein
VNENRITIRTWARGEDVFAEVADNGRGLPADSVGRIFEPFTALKFGNGAGLGLGLGLSICRNIVAEFGGDIRVESELGKGTRFLIRLPANRANRANAAPKPSAAVVSPPGAVRGRILVVDDEEEIRKTLLRALEPRHEVITVASGSEGRALLERDGAFDVILCDLMMQQMTGMELHAWLAASAPALATRVVFITGGAFTGGASDYLARVTNLTVTKPFDLAALEKLVSGFISRRTAAELHQDVKG